MPNVAANFSCVKPVFSVNQVLGTAYLIIFPDVLCHAGGAHRADGKELGRGPDLRRGVVPFAALEAQGREIPLRIGREEVEALDAEHPRVACYLPDQASPQRPAPEIPRHRERPQQGRPAGVKGDGSI